MNWCGTPAYLARCATVTFLAADSSSRSLNCRRSRFADRSKPRSPRLLLRNEMSPYSG